MSVISIISSSGGSAAADAAPNVTGATVAPTYSQVGSASVFGFSGSINLPYTDPLFSNLAEIDVVAQTGGVATTIVTLLSSQWIGFPSIPVAYSGGQLPQSSSPTFYSLSFVCRNTEGTISPSPYTIPSISIQQAGVSSISGAETPSLRTADPNNKLVFLALTATISLVSGEVPQTTLLWLSQDNGVTYTTLDYYLVTTSPQTLMIPGVVAPVTAATFKFAACVFESSISFNGGVPIPASSLPAAAVISSGFSVAALALPSASLISSLTIPSGAGGSFPYNKFTGDQSQYWEIPGVSYSDASCVSNPNAFFVRITVTSLDSSHTAISSEAPFAGNEVTTGGTQTTSVLDGNYSNGICYLRYKVYVLNRADGTAQSFANPLASTLQTGIGSGAGFVDVLVATAGGIPTGAILASRLAASSIAAPLYQDGSGFLAMKISSDFVVNGSGVMTQQAVNLANAYGFNTTNFTTSGSNLSINEISCNALIAGNAIFFGTTTFAYSGGGSVTINNTGLSLANSNTSPTATVNIGSGGITIQQSSSNIQVTASGITLTGPGGGVATFTSTGVSLSSGGSGVNITASSVQITNGTFFCNSNGATTTLNNSNITGFVKGIDVQDNSTLIRSYLYPFSLVMIGNGSGGNPAVQLSASGSSSNPFGDLHLRDTSGFGQIELNSGGTPAMYMNNTRILTIQQTGLGNPFGFADATAQAWCQNLYTRLASHGLIT